jgi:uncharacterized membrane protein
MASTDKGIGGRLAPPRFLAFIGLMAAGLAGGIPALGWRTGIMAAFDLAALAFLALSWPLVHSEADAMRRTARRNDANRALLLAITGSVMLAVLVAVAAELGQAGAPRPAMLALIVGTLAIAWLFSNVVYALHYAHLFYLDDADGCDRGGLSFPQTPEPDYWDFIYFAFCLGMTFQTSDVDTTSRRMRRVVTAHCLAAFVFNLGVIAFTINVLGGSS